MPNRKTLTMVTDGCTEQLMVDLARVLAHHSSTELGGVIKRHAFDDTQIDAVTLGQIKEAPPITVDKLETSRNSQPG